MFDEPQLLVARLVVVDMEEDFDLLVQLPEDNKGEVQDQLCTLGYKFLLQKYIKYSWNIKKNIHWKRECSVN